MADLIRPLAYFALLAASLAVAADSNRSARERQVLAAVAAIAVLAAVAETFALGGWAAHVGRTLAHDEGWYQGRRRVQAAVIVALAIFSAVAAVAAVWVTRFQSATIRGLVFLMVVLGGYVAIRTISLHQVDAYLYSDIGGTLTLGTAIEVALVAAMVLWLLGSSRSARLGQSGA